jgi:maltooligosyltrehalose synthase
VVVIAGRLFAGLAAARGAWPVGEACWGDTAVAVPALADGERLRNRIDGRTVTVRDGCVALSEVFAALPVAALERH